MRAPRLAPRWESESPGTSEELRSFNARSILIRAIASGGMDQGMDDFPPLIRCHKDREIRNADSSPAEFIEPKKFHGLQQETFRLAASYFDRKNCWASSQPF